MVNAIDCATKLTEPIIKGLVAENLKVFGRYLPTSEWKALSKAEVEAITKYDCKLFSIYEDGGNRLSHFTESQGKHDAIRAEQMARDLGQPHGTPIYFTVDFNAQPHDYPIILEYFKAVKDNLNHYEVRCYGHIYICDYLVENGICDKVFQTYAWSHGHRSKHAVIYQYKNGQNRAGITVDFNETYGDTGAWNLRKDTYYTLYKANDTVQTDDGQVIYQKLQQNYRVTKVPDAHPISVDMVRFVNQDGHIIDTGDTIKANQLIEQGYIALKIQK